ncbi:MULTISPECIES: YjcZ family sporulation protein [Bacillaceae]|uniref:YjcZ family sporulation protein n=1 Tax=Evansella alkalicola TaxID=745819 RepID=A0ABS6JS21_9BACI|nr:MULTISPECIES: YjcZ family sporulation protein [Bacillaceae]MBU9719970.1 YjcZ family sporulation protein [Bacillus alkalicola]
MSHDYGRRTGFAGGFAFVVVIFVLLVIIGAVVVTP